MGMNHQELSKHFKIYKLLHVTVEFGFDKTLHK